MQAVDSLREFKSAARSMRKSRLDVSTMLLLLGNRNACKWKLRPEIWRAELDAVLKEPDEPGENWQDWFDSEDDILNAPPVSHMIRSIVLQNRYNGVVSLPGARKTLLCWNVVRSCLTGKPLLDRFTVENAPERVIFLAAESARNEIKQRLTDMELTPFLESGKLLIRSAFMDTPFHADMIPEHLAKGALIIFDTFVRFFDGGDEQSALEARKFTEQMRRLVNLGATVLVMFHAPKGAKAETLDLQAIRGSGELGAGLVHAFSLSMQGPTWSDNTLMRQVKNREHQCDPHTFEFFRHWTRQFVLLLVKLPSASASTTTRAQRSTLMMLLQWHTWTHTQDVHHANMPASAKRQRVSTVVTRRLPVGCLRAANTRSKDKDTIQIQKRGDTSS